MSTATERENGSGWDPSTTDVHELAGVVIRIEVEQRRQTRMLEKVCQALGIEPEKSDPPPRFRAELDSLHETDAETTGQLRAVSEELAKTRLDVRFGLIKGIPRLYKALGAVALALGAAVGLATQIWAAMHGH